MTPRIRTVPALLLLVVAACTNSSPASPPPSGGGGMPPAEVGVVTIKTEQITLQTELSGRTAARLTSELRPQVSGIVKERTFEEGARVKAGQVLYRIDSSMYRAVYAQATADLSSAKAMLEAAQTRNERYAKLMAIEGVSKQEADDARAAYQQAQATVAQKQAALQAAKINLDYTSIKAPIAGRIGTSTVTVGALVTAGQPEPLATIRSLDPIFVDLTESSEVRLKLRAQLGAGTLKEGSARVKLRLGDGSLYPHDGTLEFAEVAVDEATGTVTLRAQFPNPDDTLLPGMYVRAVLDQGIDQEAILAPQQGITHDATGKAAAMVVDAKGMVEARTVVADRAIGDRWLITDGLRAGDKLIVEGLGKIGPGMPVHATEVTVGAQAGSGAAPPPPPADGSGSNGSGSGGSGS